jgi:hypothetical protein
MSALSIWKPRVDPRLDEFTEPRRLLNDFLGLSFGRNMRPCVIDHVALAATRLELVSVLIGVLIGAERQVCGVERDLVMACLGHHAIARSGDRHVCRLERHIVRRRVFAIRGETFDLRVGEIARHERSHVIELLFRRPMMLNVLAGQQFRPGHAGFLVRILLSRATPPSGSGPCRLPSFEIPAANNW